MNINTQCIALYTVTRREVKRMVRIASQTFLPPVITTLLYFLIFGTVIGDRIGVISGHTYTSFITPGLIALGVIVGAHSNVTGSLFTMRFQRSIEEALVSPMHWCILLLGFVLGGVIRGSLTALLITCTAAFFVKLEVFRHIPITCLIIFFISCIFSLTGFLNAILARTFDDIAIIPTFVLTPLIYLGGVFYSTTMLSSFWQKVTLFNPIYYMVHALRYVMLDHTSDGLTRDLLVMGTLFLTLLTINVVLIKKGVGLRE